MTIQISLSGGTPPEITVDGGQVIGVAVNGQTGPSLTASTGDTIQLSVTKAGAPGGQGVAGPPGSVNLSDDTPQALGSAVSGTSSNASRSDHVHPVPSIAYSSLTGVPSTFAPASHTHPLSALTQSSATTGQVPQWNGSAWVPATPASGGSYTLPTATSSVLGGVKVGSGLSISSGVLSATGGGSYTLPTASDSVLGGVKVGSGLSISSGVLSASGGIGANDTVDGGTYVGTQAEQTITITSQPTNQTATGTSYSQTAYTLPSGTWGTISLANGVLFATPNDTLGGDYIATSYNGTTWTKRVAALPYAGQWSKVVYGNGVYVTFLSGGGPSGTWCAYSSDGVTWTAQQISATSGLAVVAHSFIAGGGGWFVATNNASGTSAKWVQSQDGQTWSTVSLATNLGMPLFALVPNADGTQVMAWNLYQPYTATASVTSSGIGQFDWSGQPLGASTTNGIWQLIHDGTTWVAVGSNQAIDAGLTGKWTSGTSWTEGSFAVPIFSVTYRNNRYVACTGSGVASSSDALTWVLRQSFASGAGSVLSDTSGHYASLRSSSNVNSWVSYSSPDGLTWTSRVSGGLVQPSVTFSGKILVSTASPLSTGYVVDVGGLLSATFTVAAQAVIGSVSYQWQTGSGSSWTNVAGATSGSLVLTNLTTASNGTQYRAVVSASGVASVNSNTATLTVN